MHTVVSETKLPSKQNYNLNIEILRVTAMIMIICGHLIGHGYVLENMKSPSVNYYLISFLQIVCFCATNIYVIVSGYLLCEKRFTAKRVASFWLQVWVWSLLGFLGGLLITGQFSLGGLLKALLPISGNQYWFARVYFGMYLCMPFLNIFINNLNKKQHIFCLILSTILFSLWRSFLPFAVTLNAEGGNGLIWFFVLYLFGAYLRKNRESFCRAVKYKGFLLVGLWLISFLSKIVIGALSDRLGLGEKGTSLFTEFTSFPVLFSALIIVSIAVEHERSAIGSNQSAIIRFFSASTFSVYLIHENPYVKQWLFEALPMRIIANTGYVFFELILSAVLLFVLCALIDKVVFFPISKLINRYLTFPKLQKRIDRILYSASAGE